MMYPKRLSRGSTAILLVAASMLLGQAGYADDLELLVDKNVADKFLSEIAYPYVETIDTFALRESGTEAEVKIGDTSSNYTDLAEIPGLGAEIEAQVGDLLLDENKQVYVNGLGTATRNFLDALTSKKAVADAILSGDPQKLREAIRTEIAADKQLEQMMILSMREVIRVDVDWVKVRIDRKPQSSVSDPIVLSNLSLGVKARLRGCVKIIKWFCTGYVEVGFIHLEAKKLTISMLPRPPVLFGQPAFNDLDIVWSFKVFGKTFTVRVGITSLVNKGLKPFQLVDLSDFEIAIPGGQKKLKVDKIATEAAPAGLKVKVTLVVR